MEINKIYNMDCVEGLRLLPDESINVCVTSPPYFCLRDYGVEGQIGLEETPEEYIERLVQVFREVRRVLKPDGTLWVNIADSYANSGKGPSTSKSRDCQDLSKIGLRKCVPNGLKPKDLIGIPWMLAFALRADGWYLRQDIIWEKPNAMPESVKDRCTKSHEHIFLLAKEPKYYFDHEAIKEPAIKGAAGSSFTSGKTAVHQPGASTKERIDSSTRSRRDVWRISTQPFKGAHFATFPEKLVEPCIIAGCPAGGVALDPFMGSGTTAVVAIRNERDFIGFELSPEYCEIAAERVTAAQNEPKQLKIEL